MPISVMRASARPPSSITDSSTSTTRMVTPRCAALKSSTKSALEHHFLIPRTRLRNGSTAVVERKRKHCQSATSGSTSSPNNCGLAVAGFAHARRVGLLALRAARDDADAQRAHPADGGAVQRGKGRGVGVLPAFDGGAALATSVGDAVLRAKAHDVARQHDGCAAHIERAGQQQVAVAVDAVVVPAQFAEQRHARAFRIVERRQVGERGRVVRSRGGKGQHLRRACRWTA